MFKRRGPRSFVCREERGRGMRGVYLTGNAARRPLVHRLFLIWEIDWLGRVSLYVECAVCACVCARVGVQERERGSGERASERANERAEAGEEDKTRQDRSGSGVTTPVIPSCGKP